MNSLIFDLSMVPDFFLQADINPNQWFCFYS